MKISIIVATHKEYRMPADPLYLPLQVGASLHQPLPYPGDNTGESISGKNATFCELTGLYWAWKNLNADAVGLCHYRRYFAGRHFSHRRDKWDRILTAGEAQELLEKAPVLLPRKLNYYIETGYSQYAHAHHEEDLIAAREILS